MRGRLFNLPAVARAAGFALMAAAMFATAIRLGHYEPSPRLPRMVVVPQSDSLTHEITRCDALGRAAEQDARCDAAWAENRQRFFSYRPADSRSRPTQMRDQPAPNPEDR
jgi:conjugative transfer region protein TrbK